METIKKYWKQAIIAALVAILFSVRLTIRVDANEVQKNLAEAELQRLIPEYNRIAPQLKAQRAVLNSLGYEFDDKTLKAVPLAQ